MFAKNQRDIFYLTKRERQAEIDDVISSQRYNDLSVSQSLNTQKCRIIRSICDK